MCILRIVQIGFSGGESRPGIQMRQEASRELLLGDWVQYIPIKALCSSSQVQTDQPLSRLQIRHLQQPDRNPHIRSHIKFNHERHGIVGHARRITNFRMEADFIPSQAYCCGAARAPRTHGAEADEGFHERAYIRFCA